MELTRVDTVKLKAAVEGAVKKIDEAFALLEPYLVVLSDQERAKTPRARDGFGEAATSLSRAIADHPNIAATAGFDAEAVLEDLANVREIQPLIEKLTELHKRVADSKLVWLAEAWIPSLTAYAVAKAVSKTNAALRTVIAPLAEMFATRRGRAGKPDPEK
jgi:hypothetical protein